MSCRVLDINNADDNQIKTKLNLIASIWSCFAGSDETHKYFVVKDTYLDYGADWMWTTIICLDENDHNDHFQTLYPRDWEEIADCPMRSIPALATDMYRQHTTEYPRIYGYPKN